MKTTRARPDIQALLPLTAILWLCYLLGLCLVDNWLFPQPIFGSLHYGLNGALALAALALVSRSRRRSGGWHLLVPALIVCMSVVPLLTGHASGHQLPPHEANRPESIILRHMPLLMMALVLTAWQYGWRHVVAYTACISLLTLWLYGGGDLGPRARAPLAPLTIMLIQAASFLVVGYYVSALIGRLHHEEQRLREANARLAEQATTVEELAISRERNRMARELHDTLAHTLSALSVQLETAKAYGRVDPDAAHAILETALSATRAGLQETRRALRALRAQPIEELGLPLALRELVGDAAERADLALEADIPPKVPALSPTLEQCLYRIAQEAVSNAVHHANARHLRIALQVSDKVTLCVADDGRGISPDQLDQPGHYGLAGMRERAERVGGTLTIESPPEGGTVVQLTLARHPSERALQE